MGVLDNGGNEAVGGVFEWRKIHGCRVKMKKPDDSCWNHRAKVRRADGDDPVRVEKREPWARLELPPMRIGNHKVRLIGVAGARNEFFRRCLGDRGTARFKGGRGPIK